jgi:hypothetical protein
MQRWNIIVGAVLVAIIGALLWKDRSNPATAASSKDGGAATAEGGVLDDTFGGFLQAEGGVALGLVDMGDADTPGSTLPAGSPKTVRFGVILVQYRGAQGAPASARPKDDAMVLAKSLAEAAKLDFKAQVAKGDPGSVDDAGKIPRGVLEPASEYALFTMSPGTTSGPIDTPRGFWIVRRIE